MIKVSQKSYKDIVEKVGKDKMDELTRTSKKPTTKEIVKVQAGGQESNLQQNKAKIIQLHESIVSALVRSLEDALAIGGLLFEQKEIVKRADRRFTQWVRDNLPFSLRTAERYMKLYQYREALHDSSVTTITEAYAHIHGEPISDEIVDADDSLKTSDIVVTASVNLDELTLPKKKAKGLVQKLTLTKASIEDMVSGSIYQNRQGCYMKFIVELSGGNVHNKRIGEFVCAAERYLRPGGKIIFYKR